MKTLIRATVLVITAYFVATYVLNPIAASLINSAHILEGLTP